MKNIKKKGSENEIGIRGWNKERKTRVWRRRRRIFCCCCTTLRSNFVHVRQREGGGGLSSTLGGRDARDVTERERGAQGLLWFSVSGLLSLWLLACFLDPKDWFRGEDQDKKGRRRRSSSSDEKEEGREGEARKEGRKEAAMGFLVISLYYLLTALVGSLLVRVCFNKGKSTNM